MKERWKVWCYNGEPTRYEISDRGQIHDTIKNIYTFGNRNPEGYMKYTFYLNNGTAVSKLVHRLVGELFVYNPKENEYGVIDHINAIRDDNRADNLRWCTNEMNIQYAVEKGSMAKKTGEGNPRHKYTKEQIRKAIDMLKTGKYTAKEISKEAGVHIHTVRDLLYKRIWSDEFDDSILSVKDGLKKFSDEQILEVIKMLNGEYTVKEISDRTGVTKVVIRCIYNRTIYRYLTDSVPNLSYKKISPRANPEAIAYAVQLLETKNYTCKEIRKLTGLSRSIVEKLAYHKRWPELTQGKDLGFKGSKNQCR